MGISYSKIFTATDAINHEPLTILVEAIDPIGGETFVVVKALEGEYVTREEFEDAREYSLKGWERGYTLDKGERKLYSSITLKIPGAEKLVHVLNEVLKTSEEV